MYLTCTTSVSGHLLQALEIIIRTKPSPALTGRSPPNDAEHNLLALQAMLGGIAQHKQISSTRITEPLKEAILQHLFQYTEDVGQLHIKGSNCLCRQRCESYLRGQTTLEQLLALMNTFMHFMQAKCNNGQGIGKHCP